MTTAVLLAGGLGTRLRAVVADRQKVVADVGGRPFLHHLLDDLATQGITRVVLAVGHQADTVREAVGDRYGALDIAYSVETSPLGTGGALANARPLLSEDEPSFVLNADAWCDVDLGALRAFHEKCSARCTLTLTSVADTGRFGAIDHDEKGRVLAFREKGRSGPGAINAGVYLIEPDAWKHLPEGPSSLERDLFPTLPGLFGYPGGGRFIDIGLPDSYGRAAGVLSGQSAGARRLVLVDRDGTLNREVHHLTRPEQVEVLPGAARALRRLRENGLSIGVVTNQSAVGRGLLDEATLARVHQRLRDDLAAQGASWDALAYCPHLPDAGCDCRKPRPGLARRVADEVGLPLAGSFLIGDDRVDVGLARAVGATAILVRTGHGDNTDAALADHVVPDLWCATVLIERLLGVSA